MLYVFLAYLQPFQSFSLDIRQIIGQRYLQQRLQIIPGKNQDKREGYGFVAKGAIWRFKQSGLSSKV